MNETMTNEVMEMVADDVVIDAAEEIVVDGGMNLLKVGGKIGVYALAAYGAVKFVKDVAIPVGKKLFTKKSPDVIDAEAEEVIDAIDDMEVGIVEE